MVIFTKLLISNIKNWNKKVLITIIVSLFISTSLITGLIISLETFEKKIKEGMETLGVNRIILRTRYYLSDFKEGGIIPYRYILTLKQWCPTIDELSCVYHGGNEGDFDVILLRNKKKTNAFNLGVSEGLGQVMGFKIKEGKFIEAKDEGESVCVLTEELANRLDARIGDTIKYTVKDYDEKEGIPKERSYYLKIKGIITVPSVLYIIDSHFSSWGKDVIYVPVMTKWQLKLFGKTGDSMDKELKHEYWEWGEVYMKVNNVNRAIVEIENILKAKYGKENMFFVDKDEYLISEFKRVEKIYRLVLGIIGIGTLSVGIGSIFFTFLSFTHTRRREIGIKRACGAKKRDICKEFLAEGMLIITLPIILGLIAGMMGSKIILKTPIFPPDALFCGVGLIFSFLILAILYPAIRAALILPAEAVRE